MNENSYGNWAEKIKKCKTIDEVINIYKEFNINLLKLRFEEKNLNEEVEKSKKILADFYGKNPILKQLGFSNSEGILCLIQEKIGSLVLEDVKNEK